MGFIRRKFGRTSIETRGESFIIHPGYGYDESGNEHTNLVPTEEGLVVREQFAERWRTGGHPEFTYESLDELIAALVDLRADRHARGSEPLLRSRLAADLLKDEVARLLGSDTYNIDIEHFAEAVGSFADKWLVLMQIPALYEAINLMDEADRYSSTEEGYGESPFEQKVIAFLHRHGRRSEDGVMCYGGEHLSADRSAREQA